MTTPFEYSDTDIAVMQCKLERDQLRREIIAHMDSIAAAKEKLKQYRGNTLAEKYGITRKRVYYLFGLSLTVLNENPVS